MQEADESGGADRDRTDDLRLAKPALSQLSYSPLIVAIPGVGTKIFFSKRERVQVRGRAEKGLVGLGGFEPPTSRLSGGRSNQLSYRPARRQRCSRSPKTE